VSRFPPTLYSRSDSGGFVNLVWQAEPSSWIRTHQGLLMLRYPPGVPLGKGVYG
jgi:hypothetical protein